MKKNLIFSLFLGLALILSFSSCKKDEDTTPPASVVSKFSAVSDNDYTAPSVVTCTNESVVPATAGTATYAWDFGDGGTSTDKNPVHTYTASGNYTIKLTVKSNVEDAVSTLDITVKAGELFSEDFESFNPDGDNLPNTWVIIDNDGGTPDDPLYDVAWKVVSSSRFGSNVAISTSYYTTPVTADDWMILPSITIYDNTFLSWEAMSLTSSGNYLDSYEVYVSTTTQDMAGCKAATGKMIKQVIEEQASLTASGTPGLGVQSYEIDLSEFAGKDIFIAFRLMTPSDEGSELGIDNIKVFLK